MSTIIKKYITPLLFMLLAGLITGCEQEIEAYGELQVQLATDESMLSKMSEQKAAELIYQLKIINKADQKVVFETSDHTQMPERFKLKAGNYTVQAVSGNPKEMLSTVPAFMAIDEIEVVAGGVHQMAMTAYLAQVKVKMTLSDVIIDNFPLTNLTLKQQENDKIIAVITKADVNKEFYIGYAGTLYWTLDLQNTQGANFKVDGIMGDVQPRDFVHFDFKMTDIPAQQGVAMIGVTLNKNLETFDHYIVMLHNPGKAPEAIAEGNFTDGKPISVNSYRRGVKAAYNITSENKIKSLSFYHYDPTIEGYGVPKAITFNKLDQTQVDAIAAAGLAVTGATEGSAEASIDFSGLCDKLPLGVYPLTLTILDQNGQMTKKLVTINVLPDDLEILEAHPWGKMIRVKARFLLDENPGGLSFEYKKSTESVWMTIPTDKVTVSGTEFSASIQPLEPTTLYDVRAISIDGPAQPKQYTTQIAVDFPNLDFQTWAHSSPTWYPNASATTWLAFWNTGNEGTANSMVNNPRSNTYPDDTDKERGRVIKMESIWVGAPFGQSTFAAGNIFTGYFKTNMGDPIKSAKMGRKYTSRPMGMKGEAKYISKNINRNKGGGSFDKYVGTPDKGAIVFRLEKWQNPNQNPEDFGGGNKPSGTPIIIADGILEINDTGGQYVKFEMRMNYRDTKTIPTHVVFTASSSIYGENFCGGEGSTLWLDNMELIWTD